MNMESSTNNQQRWFSPEPLPRPPTYQFNSPLQTIQTANHTTRKSAVNIKTPKLSLSLQQLPISRPPKQRPKLLNSHLKSQSILLKKPLSSKNNSQIFGDEDEVENESSQ